MHMTREELELLAKALTDYKQALNDEIISGTDLEEYNRIEMSHADELAEKLNLDPEYYQPGVPDNQQPARRSMQVIELTTKPGPRFCYICGKKICGTSKIAKDICPHVLFIATSEGGTEYCPPHVNRMLPEEPSFSDYKRLPFPNSVLILEGSPPPSGLEFYVGISPDTKRTATAKRRPK